MKYLSATDVANTWGVSSTQVRKYCREGRIPGAFFENNAWYVPETAVKPTRKETAEQEKEVLFPVAKVLRRQMKKKNFHGLYDYVQINFAYRRRCINRNPDRFCVGIIRILDKLRNNTRCITIQLSTKQAKNFLINVNSIGMHR